MGRETAEQFIARCLWLRDDTGHWYLNPAWIGTAAYAAALPEYIAKYANR